jgi:methionyl-tRNA formyltransferase
MALRIVFMGTPEFAVTSLAKLQGSAHEVVSVVTAVDKMGGRGRRERLTSAVKKYALANDIPVLQPPNLKAPEFVDSLQQLQADLFVVVAFRMLPEVVWSMPPEGTMNLHGSLLPKFRGAAPINWAIIHGETETGVTTFLLKHAIDTGDILMQRSMPIGPDDTAGDIHDQMKVLGAEVVLKSVNAIARGTAETTPQDDTQATKAPKIHHTTCEIDFRKSTEEVYNFIRGLSPHPPAWPTLDGMQLNIYNCRPSEMATIAQPGMIFTDNRSFLRVATGDGAIDLRTIQLQGRKRMEVQDFLNGYQVQARIAGLKS